MHEAIWIPQSVYTNLLENLQVNASTDAWANRCLKDL